MVAESVRYDPAQSSVRGDDTRRRLIDAALQIFGTYGFEGAGTRAVADKADANLAAIPYYFGSKEGLYRAVAHSIVDDANRELLPVMERIDCALHERNLPRKSAVGLLHELLDNFSSLVVGSRRAASWSRFIMREQLQPGAAFEILFEGLMRRVSQTLNKLLAHLIGTAPGDSRVAVLAQMILGQALIFHTCGEATLRVLSWKEFSPEKVKMIQSLLRENVDLLISGTHVKHRVAGSRKSVNKGSRHHE